MAIYHCSVKMIGRNAGKSAVGAAAYRSGSALKSEFDGVTRDYTRKGYVEHTEILLPENAPREYLDRETLWNAVERVEKTMDAQLAREVEVSLPVELDREKQLEILHRFVNENFVSQGMCADIAIHNPPVRNDLGQPIDKEGHPTKDVAKMQFINPHAHILLTVRPIAPGGKWEEKAKAEYLCVKDGVEKGFTSDEFKAAKEEGWEKQYKYIDGKRKVYLPASVGNERGLKRIDRTPKTSRYGRKNPTVAYWNSEERIYEWRSSWENCVNAQFEAEGIAERIDSRSYEKQGKELLPTIHMGPAATNIERRARRLSMGRIAGAVARSDIADIISEIHGINDWILQALGKMAKHISVADEEVIRFVDECIKTGRKFLMPKPDTFKVKPEDMAEVVNPEKIKMMVIDHRLYTFVAVKKYKDIGLKVYVEYREGYVSLQEKVKNLQMMIDTYSQFRELGEVFKESKKKSGLSKYLFDRKHEKELEAYKQARDKYRSLISKDQKADPKGWRREMQALKKEMGEIQTKMQALALDLARVSSLERTYSERPRESLREKLSVAKEKVTRNAETQRPKRKNNQVDL